MHLRGAAPRAPSRGGVWGGFITVYQARMRDTKQGARTLSYEASRLGVVRRLGGLRRVYDGFVPVTRLCLSVASLRGRCGAARLCVSVWSCARACVCL